uniref:Uncharacterized protein n=1 Tax=Cairina moschata TaxID=8855 RepID=A0A8C3BLR4_CAIMO
MEGMGPWEGWGWGVGVLWGGRGQEGLGARGAKGPGGAVGLAAWWGEGRVHKGTGMGGQGLWGGDGALGEPGTGGGVGPGGEGAFPSVAAADVPLPTAGPSTVAAALPHAVCKSQSFLASRCPRAGPGGAEQAGGRRGSPPSPIPCPLSCCPWPCTPRPADRTALGSEARQGGHGHDARGCWGRHQHASAREYRPRPAVAAGPGGAEHFTRGARLCPHSSSLPRAGREYAQLDGRTRCRTGQDGGAWGVGRGRGVPRAVGRGVPIRVVAAAGGPQEGVGWGALVSPPGSRRCWGATAQPRALPEPGVPQGYTPLHIAALHGHRQIVELLIERFGAKQNLRDYSGHLAGHYLSSAGTLDGDPDTPQLPSGRGERGRNRRLGCLLLPKAGGAARRRWGSAEDLAQPEEERAPAQLLAPPASYRAVRKFSR